jgi:hypothetical protein
MEAVHIGNSEAYLTKEHVQFPVNWIFCDEENPAHLFAGASNADTAMTVIYKYCCENWKRLVSFMIFFVRNIEKVHWILDVAMNPYRVIANAAGISVGDAGDAQLYGFLKVDLLKGNNTGDGTIPTSNGISKDSRRVSWSQNNFVLQAHMWLPQW